MGTKEDNGQFSCVDIYIHYRRITIKIIIDKNDEGCQDIDPLLTIVLLLPFVVLETYHEHEMVQ